MDVLPLPPRVHIFTYLCMCGCVCERETACVCVVHSETQQKSVSQSWNWRKLAIWEDQCAATLVVIVFLMFLSLETPIWRLPIFHVDHVFSCSSRVCACVAARVSLHVYSYYLYWWALQLLPCCAAEGVFVLFAGAVMNVPVRKKEKENEKHSEWVSEKEALSAAPSCRAAALSKRNPFTHVTFVSDLYVG